MILLIAIVLIEIIIFSTPLFFVVYFALVKLMSDSIKISAAIITFNEERNIGRCIDSLIGVVDEILVLDSFSKDKTKEICLAKGVRFEEHSFDGHIQQKNRVITMTNHKYVLSLDADECLDDQLKKSILKLKENFEKDGYSMNRLTYYCGHWVKHCGWYPDAKIRLFEKGKGKWTGINPHDKFVLLDPVNKGWIEGDILHYSYYSREDHLKQIEYFSSIAAEELNKRGKKSSWPLIIIKVIAQYTKSLLLKVGFLDGKTGFAISRLSAFATYRKYYKLLKLNRGEEI